jgi:transposase
VQKPLRPCRSLRQKKKSPLGGLPGRCLRSSPTCAESLWASNKINVLGEKSLAPTLQLDDIVIIDNASIHKVTVIGVAEAIESVGAKLLYLPQYWPDFNPIEQAFKKLKALLRKAAERTVPNLQRRIAKLLPCFTAIECANFLANAGYAPT